MDKIATFLKERDYKRTLVKAMKNAKSKQEVIDIWSEYCVREFVTPCMRKEMEDRLISMVEVI